MDSTTEIDIIDFCVLGKVVTTRQRWSQAPWQSNTASGQLALPHRHCPALSLCENSQSLVHIQAAGTSACAGLPFPNKQRPAVILQGASKDLAGASRVLVDQHRKWCFGEGCALGHHWSVAYASPTTGGYYGGPICMHVRVVGLTCKKTAIPHDIGHVRSHKKTCQLPCTSAGVINKVVIWQCTIYYH